MKCHAMCKTSKKQCQYPAKYGRYCGHHQGYATAEELKEEQRMHRIEESKNLFQVRLLDIIRKEDELEIIRLKHQEAIKLKQQAELEAIRQRQQAELEAKNYAANISSSSFEHERHRSEIERRLILNLQYRNEINNIIHQLIESHNLTEQLYSKLIFAVELQRYIAHKRGECKYNIFPIPKKSFAELRNSPHWKQYVNEVAQVLRINIYTCDTMSQNKEWIVDAVRYVGGIPH